MDNETTQRRFESVFSTKVRAGKRRTYFFDVRRTKGDDFYITLTESTKKFNGDGYERHKLFLYKEDFNRFLSSLTDVIDHVKTDLMPDYDYDEFTRKQLEWEEKRTQEEAAGTFSQESNSAADPQPAISNDNHVDSPPVPDVEDTVEQIEDPVEDEVAEPTEVTENAASEETEDEDMSW